MTRRYMLAAALVFMTPTIQASSGGTERSTQLGLDARTIGMGSITSALPDDSAASLDGNPALLSSLSKGGLVLLHAPLFEGSRYEAFSIAIPSMDRGGWGLSYVEIRSPEVEVRDQANFLIRTFTYAERQLNIGWGGNLPIRNLSLGIRGSWHQMVMDMSRGNSFGFDGGLAYRATNKKWTLGLSSRSLVDSGLKLLEERERPAQGVVLGGNVQQKGWGGLWTLGAEAVYVSGEGVRPAVGAEYVWKNTAAIRGGWDGRQPSAGAGIITGDLNIQYAMTFQDRAGSTHRVSAGWKFGKDVGALRQARRSKEERMKQEILGKLKSDSIHGYLKAGDAFLADNKFEEARAEYNKTLAWDPQNENAIDRLKKTETSEKSHSISTKLSEAKKLAAEGNDLDAMVLYKGVLELEPTHSVARKGLSDSQARMRSASRKAFVGSSSLPPAEAQQYFEEGLDLYASGKYSQALDKWKRIVASNPIQRQIFDYVSRAQTKLETGQVEAAQKQKAAVKADRMSLLKRQAFDNYRKGDLKGAIAVWNEILTLDPKNLEAQTELDKAQKELQESRKRGVRW